MKKQIRRLGAGIVAAVGLLALSGGVQAQQKNEISITRQPGILYLPTHIIEKQHLIEKQAAKLGLPELKPSG